MMAAIRAAFKNISGVIFLELDLTPIKRLVIGLGAFALVIGCAPDPEGDGTGSSNISGLEMATTMSVVTPTGGFTGSSALLASAKLSASDLKDIISQVISGQVFDPESDYEKDKTSVSVKEDANESLEFANMLLCFIEQTRMKELVNTGPYTAFLNPIECIPGLSEVGYFRVVVESKRAFEHSPQYVNVWVPFADFLGSDWGGGMVVETVIYEEVSAIHPVGQFEMKMSMEITAPVGEGGEFPPLTMNTRTVDRSDGRVEFISFFEQGDPFVQDYDRYSMGAANVLLDDPQGNSGASLTFERDIEVKCQDEFGVPLDPCILETTQDGYEVIYNSTHLYRHNTGLIDSTEACFDRTSSFYEVDDYGIYFEQDGVINGTPVTSGQRVSDGERFGFEYLGRVGWVERGDVDWYSGDPSIILPDNASIISTGINPKTFIIHRSEGRLERLFGRQEMVSNITGAPFWGNGSNTGNYPGTVAQMGAITGWDTLGRAATNFGFDRWRIVINPTTLDFEVVAGEIVDPMTGEATISPVVVPAAVINSPVDGAGNPTNTPLYLRSTDWFDLVYDDSLFVTPAARYATYNAEYERMYPWHSDLYDASTEMGSTRTLYCYSDCLIGGITVPMPATVLTYPVFGTAAPSAGGVITGAVNLPATEGGLRTYQLESTGKKYRLIDNSNGQDVALLDTSNVSYNRRSSRQLRETAIPLINMIHPGLNPGGAINANNLSPLGQNEVEYVWETGSDDGAKGFAISQNTAADPVVTFGEKLQFFYQHDIADDVNDALNFPQVERWDNSVHLLTYNGYFGSNFPNFGWPYTSSRDYNVRSINMTKGVVLSDFDGVNYVIKPIDIDQLLIEFENPPGTPDPLPCKVVLDVTRAQNELQLPTADSVNPMIVKFGDIPIPVNTPPKVIGGIIQ